MTSLDTLLDLLDHGRDGEPRWVRLEAADAHAASSLLAIVAAEAERRGYVTVAAEGARRALAEMPHRTMALLQTCSGGAPPDAAPLMMVAARSPRPHVLISVSVGPRTATQGPLVREARAAYAAALAPPAVPLSPDGGRYLARAVQAFALARQGRHAPAVRMLREALAALIRRREPEAAARASLLLGRLLLDRGKPDDAAAAFAEAVTLLDPVRAGEAAIARVWVAIARTDAGRLTEAEALLRATRLADTLPPGIARRWADAALARLLLWQERGEEAAALVAGGQAIAPSDDPLLVVPMLATHARLHLALGHVFDAGQRARAAIEWADRSGDAVLVMAGGTAQLRVLVATGDLDLAADRKGALLAHARRHHLPLHALRVRLLWVEMLRLSGREHEAARELQACARIGRAAPELIKRQLHRLAEARRAAPRVPAPAAHGRLAVELVRYVHDEEDDRTAVHRALACLGEHLRAGRTELQSAAGGALATLVSAGTGLPARIGQRALDAGIRVGPEQRDGVWQAAAPVRVGQRLLGVLTCRWTLGREAPPGAPELLDLAAAIVAPRAEQLLAARAEIARAAGAVPELIGDSDAIVEVRRAIGRAATAPFAVLIEGESGVGKELVARAIHHLSARRDRRFCDVNCAALPDDLVEAELFGHAKGAFTGALVERRGLFEEASGGTLFLDELPDLSLRAQAKLLRVVQQGEIRRIGESFGRRVDVRMVTATNRAMGEEVAAGRFRQDLLYRLDVLRISIPPLRERPADIPVLARHFWAAAAERAATRAVLSHAVLAELSRYHWPGNVRELQNVMAALAVAAPARGAVRPSLLPPAIAGTAVAASGRLADARRSFERRFIEIALARAGGSRTKAAAQLGLSRQGLLKLMARVGLAAAAAPCNGGGERQQ